jgi:uncharacterized protein DUF6448
MKGPDFPAHRCVLLFAACLLASTPVLAHCDTMEGPVVAAAKIALQSGEVSPVLKWVRPEHEKEIRAAFARTMTVRAGGREARELADTWFFETLVRMHRAGEGAPYNGLAPAGTPIDRSISLSDKALASEDPAELLRFIGGTVADGIRQRFARAAEAKKRAEESAARGREYVAAYVELTHYVERLQSDATSAAAPHAHGEHEAAPAHEH